MKNSENNRQLTSLACALIALAIVVLGVFCIRGMRAGGTNTAAGIKQSAAATTDKTKDSAVPEEGEGSPAASANKGGTVQASGGESSVQSNTTVEQRFTMPEGAEYEPQEVLVRVPEGLSQEELEQSLVDIPGVHVGQTNGDGLVTLELEEGLSVEDAINQLLAKRVVDDAQPNYVYYALDEKGSGVAGLVTALEAYDDQTSSAPLVAMEDSNNNQAGNGNQLEVDDPLVPLQYYLDDMHVPEAWQLARGEKDAHDVPVTVAVLDVGFDASHEDLVDNVVARLNAIDDSEDVANTASRSLHGTHVAGVVAGRANNGLGIAGVSYNAQLALVRVADSNGRASSATLAHAFDWVVSRKDELNVRVANVSLGASWASSSYTTQDRLLMSKIDEARAKGIVTVAAAGNASSNNGVVPYAEYPGDLSSVVSVINIDRQHNRASGSNYNLAGERNKNISAPGTDILSTYGSAYAVTYEGERYSGYSNLTGTSTSAPSVSGILALEFAANPALSADEAVDILYATATDLGEDGWDETFGYGEAMALDAVSAATGATISGPRYLAVGAEDVTFAVTGSDGVAWSFASSDTNVVSIDAATGIAHPVAKGVATITAADGNGVTLAKTVTVFAGVQGSDTVEFGETATYTIEQDMSDYQTWSWSSSNEDIAQIGASSGVLVPVSAGKTTIIATLLADPYLTFSKEVEVTPISIAKATVADVEPQTFTGSEIEPSVTVTLDGTELVQGTDYTVSYIGNVNVGTATILVTGAGGYGGTATATFTIVAADLANASAAITEQVYTGSPIQTEATVTLGEAVLAAGTDYTIAYANNVNVGTATAMVLGKGNCTGSVTTTFDIVPASLEGAIFSQIEAQEFTGGALTPDFTVTVGDRQLVAGTDYSISYADNENVGTATISITGCNNYTGNASTTFEIVEPSRTDITDQVTIDEIEAQTFTGLAIEPEVAVRLDKQLLAKGSDYTMTYANNINAGTAEVTVTGAGDYTGEVKASFTINPADLSGATFSAIADQHVTDSAQEPFVMLALGSVQLVRDQDYTLAYNDNQAVGTASVVATGVGNYCGEVRTTFQIVEEPKTPISSASIEVDSASVEYTGEEQRPGVMVTIDGVGLVQDVDYTLFYLDNIDVGTGTIVVSGTGVYDGSAMVEFEIAPVDLEALTIEPIKDQYATGTAAEPAVTVTWGSKTLALGTDYSVGYEDNVELGTATVTVTGMGNFTGTTTTNFEIVEAPKVDISQAELSAIADQTYDGLPKEPAVSVSIDGTALVAGRDYTVSYSSNVGAGTATVKVSGVGGYTGEVSTSFAIAPASIEQATIATIPNLAYFGEALTPAPEVTLGDSVLMPGTDYDVSYKDNDRCGTASLTVAGKGNFTGSKSATFRIVELPKNGWVNLADGGKGYAKNGELVKGWLDLDKAKYYFDEDGRMLVGWNDVVVDGKVMRYYFHPSGNLARDTWATIDGKNYYFRPSGNMATGWATITDNGVDKKYYFLEDGTLVKGTWRDIENDEGVTNHYYFRPSGSMATEWAEVGGKMFFFRPSGNMAAGFADVPDDKFKRFFDSDGSMATGWRDINGNRYYFRSSGAMQTGSAVIDGTTCVFNDKGVLVG